VRGRVLGWTGLVVATAFALIRCGESVWGKGQEPLPPLSHPRSLGPCTGGRA
jgi:hypothetical protein